MSNTAIANFYKSTTHDYESFFKNYEASAKEKEINARIKHLTDQLEEARVEMTKVQNNRYNSDLLLLERKLLFTIARIVLMLSCFSICLRVLLLVVIILHLTLLSLKKLI